MGNSPSSSSSSALPSSPPPPSHVPSRDHTPPPGDAPALMQGHLVSSRAQPAQASSLSSGPPKVSLAERVRGERDERKLEDFVKKVNVPPGRKREGDESKASTMFRSRPTTDNLAKKVTVGRDKQKLEELPKISSQEVQKVVAVVAQEGPASVKKELATLLDESVSPEVSQVSSEEPLEEVAKVDEEAEEVEASQEATLIVHETPFILEDPSPYQASFVSSDCAPSLVEDASDTQSEHFTTFTEYTRSDTPHAILDDIRAASSTPSPVTDEIEGQWDSTQNEEAQSSPLAPGKRIPWGSVEAQLAYTHPQKEEHMPPALASALLPAERAARLVAAHQHVLSMAQKLSRELKPGLYTATDVQSLDLSDADDRSQIELSPHGWKDQQWEFQSCGTGFVIKNVSAGLFLSRSDPQGLHGGGTEVVIGQFPTCWDIVIMGNGSADEEDDDDDVYAHIRLPQSEMALTFNRDYAGAQLFLTKDANMSTLWRLRAPRREQVVEIPPVSSRPSDKAE